jgi:hypothetical protein
MRPEPTAGRWLPLHCLLIVAALAGGAAAVPMAIALSRMAAPIELERAAGQRAVLDVLDQEIGRALGLGIPLARLPDLDAHLAATLDQLPGLTAVHLRMADGFVAEAGVPGSEDAAQQADLAGEGTLTLYRAPDRSLPRRLWTAAAAVGLAAGLLAAVLAWAVVLRPMARAERAVAARLAAVAAGDFASTPPAPTGLPADAVAAEIEEWRARVARSHALIERQAAGLRAIDFDETLTPQVAAVLDRVGTGRRFGGPVA